MSAPLMYDVIRIQELIQTVLIRLNVKIPEDNVMIRLVPYVHKHTCIYVYVRMYVHTCIYVYVRMYVHTCTHTYTHIHAFLYEIILMQLQKLLKDHGHNKPISTVIHARRNLVVYNVLLTYECNHEQLTVREYTHA